MQWRLKKNGEVLICLYYNALRGSTSVTFPKIFGCEGPLESYFFFWLALGSRGKFSLVIIFGEEAIL